jgi:2-amino-4-hydroxy-6-hydroxymethyldihydropteridine diphosphokinase
MGDKSAGWIMEPQLSSFPQKRESSSFALRKSRDRRFYEGDELGNAPCVAQLYAIAIGSNRPHGRHGRPAGVVEAAIARLDQEFGLFDASPIVLNPAHGNAGRDFANAVALVESVLEPPAMLHRLKRIEREFGRRPGKRWGPRVLDLDIALWSGGKFRSRRLSIPHPELPRRSFVVGPMAAVAPGWRVDGKSVRQLAHRLARKVPRG